MTQALAGSHRRARSSQRPPLRRGGLRRVGRAQRGATDRTHRDRMAAPRDRAAHHRVHARPDSRAHLGSQGAASRGAGTRRGAGSRLCRRIGYGYLLRECTQIGPKSSRARRTHAKSGGWPVGVLSRFAAMVVSSWPLRRLSHDNDHEEGDEGAQLRGPNEERLRHGPCSVCKRDRTCLCRVPSYLAKLASLGL